MALNALAQRQLTYVLGSHWNATELNSRWSTGGTGSGTTTGTGVLGLSTAGSLRFRQRLARTMGHKAATLFVANLNADSTMVGGVREKLAYAMGPGGKGQVTEMAATMTA